MSAAERATQRSRGSWATTTSAPRAWEQSEEESREYAERQAREAREQAAAATTQEEREAWTRRAERYASEAS